MNKIKWINLYNGLKWTAFLINTLILTIIRKGLYVLMYNHCNCFF